MEYKIIDDFNQLLNYKDVWDSILKENNNELPFIELDWINAWWDCFKNDYKLLIILISNKDEIIGFCPLIINKKIFFNEIMFIGYDSASYMDFIIKYQYKEDAINFLMEILLNLKGVNIIKLSKIHENSDNYRYIKNYILLKNIWNITIDTKSYFYKINEDFLTYFNNRFSLHSRKIINNKEKRLQNLGNLKFAYVYDDHVFEMHKKRWQKKVGNSYFSNSKNIEFLKKLVFNNLSSVTKVYTLSINDKIISFICGISYKDKFIFKYIAHDEAFDILSPGEIVFKKTIEKCFNENIKVIDFGLGDEAYKNKWTGTYRNVKNIVFPSNNLLSKIVFLKYYLERKIKDTLKKIKAIQQFKRHNLGRLKHMISKDNIIYHFKRCCKLVLKVNPKRLYSKNRYRLLQKDIKENNQVKNNIRIKQASIDDIDEFSEKMNIKRCEIARRFARNDRCFMTLDSEIILYCWVSFLNIEVPKINCKININKGESFIYEFYVSKECQSKELIVNFLDSVFDELYKSNIKKCFVAIDSKWRDILD